MKRIILNRNLLIEGQLMGTLKNKVFIILSITILAAVCIPLNVSAADMEITPMMGYAIGGDLQDSLYGIIFGIPDTKDTQFEFYYSHQPTTLFINSTSTPLLDLDINYFHIGGAVYGNNFRKIKPYAAGGLGITYFDTSAGDSKTKFSLSIGGGIKVPITDNIGLRFEGRGFGTYLDGSSAVFCYNGNCSVAISGDVFWQVSAFSGVVLAF